MAGTNLDSSGGTAGPPGGASVLTRMLVATGGSEPSLSALRLALHLARDASSQVEALIVEDVYFPPGALFARGDSLAQLMRQAESLAAYAWNETERRIKQIADEHGASIAIRRESGRVADVLVGASQAASLILLGRRGCRPGDGGQLGSNAELVVRRIEKPVLLAPVKFRTPQRVLVAYGGKDMGALALQTAVIIADALELPLSVLTVEHDEQRREEIQQRAKRHQPELADRASFEHDTGEPAAAILRRAVPDTLVVMGAYGHSRLYRVVLGSVTEQVMRAARGPLLLSRKRRPVVP